MPNEPPMQALERLILQAQAGLAGDDHALRVAQVQATLAVAYGLQAVAYQIRSTG